MTTKRVFKIIGIIVLIILAVILLFMAFFWASTEWNSYSKKKEAIATKKKFAIP